ncbi:bifunctional phosphopantothenoylcysteine decarboxylase/phosphopantothenate--cysteine ligase CoaBC, partial [Chloroflexota bacterium]
MFTDKTVVLGVTGGISAYKVADLARRLTQDGIHVNTVMTEAAAKFVAPLTFQSLTKNQVLIDVFPNSGEHWIGHVNMGAKADAVVIAPATANTIAKLAAGMADNMLTCIVLATKAPVIIAPSMNDNMFFNPATQQNIAALEKRGYYIIKPSTGKLATGKIGAGRLPETAELLGHIYPLLGADGDLAGKKIVITAGGTEEAIDPVRNVSNRSSGKMGFALAEAARDRGASVTLITGATSLAPPTGVALTNAGSA